MKASLVIIVSKLDERPPQVRFPKYDEVIKALPSDRTDQPFRIAVLPRRAGRDRLVANAHGAKAAGDNRTVNRVTVADQVAWGLVAASCCAISTLDQYGSSFRYTHAAFEAEPARYLR